MNELKHHGILGMKWGVRRYQNKDGSLTAKGKKKYGTKTNFEKVKAAKLRAKNAPKVKKEEKAREKANARTQKEINKYNKKANYKVKPKNTKKKISEMSDAELKKAYDRVKMEKDYRDLTNSNVKEGKNIVSKFMSSIIKPGAQDLGKQVAKSFMAVGVNKILDKASVDGLEKVYANNKKKG